MPALARILTEEDLRTTRTLRMDLALYVAIIDEVHGGGVGGILTLADGENRRAEKRRLSLAAKERGYTLTWRKNQPGELCFVLSRPGEARPGGRARRATPRAETPPPNGRRRRSRR